MSKLNTNYVKWDLIVQQYFFMDDVWNYWAQNHLSGAADAIIDGTVLTAWQLTVMPK